MDTIAKTIALILVVVICACLTVILCCDLVPYDELVPLIFGVLALIPLIRSAKSN